MNKNWLCSCLIYLILGSSLQADPADLGNHKELKEENIDTFHTVAIGEVEIAYRATAGTMILKDAKEKPKASIFYIAYTKQDVEDETTRPITFCFNGGPGSSSVWLHLGLLGPRRIDLTKDGYASHSSRVIDNSHSLLDVTDLVFIDPVSTGYSRAASGEDPKQFYSVEGDVKSIAEFIRLYLTRYKRWSSPKFLAGESYGTTRAAVLAGHLHDDYYIDLNGLLLFSTVLNFQTITDNNKGNDLPYLLFLPTYAATAWYHQKLSEELQNKPLEEVLVEAERFVVEEYSVALLKGERLRRAQYDAVVDKLAYYTGLSPSYIDSSNLRINNLCFCHELLKEKQCSVGRFDSRYIAIEAHPLNVYISSDPSTDAIFGGFTAAFNQYINQDLKWVTDEPYKILTEDVRPWDFGNAKNEYLNVSETLREVLIRNRELKVFVASGYYDLATPYFATDYTLDHLGLDRALSDHIEVHYFEAGHMMYLYLPSLVKLKSELKKFVLQNRTYVP